MSQDIAATTDETTENQAAPQPGPFEHFTRDNVHAFVRGELNLGTLVGLHADEAYGIAKLAYNLAENGQYDEAEALADGLVTLVPEDPYFHSLLASIYIHQERFDAALVCLDAAVERDPGNLHAHVNRGEIHMRQGDFQSALQDFMAAIEIDPEGEEPMGQRARMLVAVAKAIFEQAVAKKVEGPARVRA